MQFNFIASYRIGTTGHSWNNNEHFLLKKNESETKLYRQKTSGLLSPANNLIADENLNFNYMDYGSITERTNIVRPNYPFSRKKKTESILQQMVEPCTVFR
jgi:hypothetical protein